MQAQSILNGNMDEFVTRNTLTIFESSFQIGPVAYPWGYPLILTPPLLLKGVHPLTLKLPGLFFFAGFLICLYLLTKTRLTRTESLLLVSLFAFNPLLLKFLDQILSDIPFLFFIFLGLLLTSNGKPEDTFWKKILSGMFLFLAFFVRTTGIVLFVSYLASRFIDLILGRSNRKSILVNSSMVILGFVLTWGSIALIFPDGQSSYLEQLKGLTPVILIRNINYYFALFWTFFGASALWAYPYYLLIIFFGLGAWKRFKSDQHLIIFHLFYLVALLFWPEIQGIRFIFPLLPIFLYFAFQGLKIAINSIPEDRQRISRGFMTCLWLTMIGYFLFASGIRAFGNIQSNRQINGPFDPFSSDMYNYIREETPPESVIVFWKPRAMRLFTNRDTIMVTECRRLTLGDYVVISKKAENSQVPPEQVAECNLALRNVFENRRFIVYQASK
jgi:4-amino-4-deoxy-L-arabinose transferase-like glycosyltransferase